MDKDLAEDVDVFELEDVEVIDLDGDEDNIEDSDNINIINSETLEAEVIDLATLTFNKHTKSVFCSDFNIDGTLAITGGEDDIAYLWNTSTGEVIFECTGHKDSVTEVCFNYDSQYIATGDMSGMIQVWSVRDLKLIWCYEGDDMEWLFWHSMAHVLFCGCRSGNIFVWQIPQGNCKVLVPSEDSSCTCAKLLPNGKQLLAGYEDGQFKLWNIKESNIVWSQIGQVDTITNININKDGTLAILVPNSVIIKLSDGKIISTLITDEEKDVEAALFNNELDIVVTGSLSGTLCVWDLVKSILRHQAKIEAAVTVLKWGPPGKIFVGATDGAVYVCDVKNYDLLETLTGHTGDILSLTVFKGGNKILTTSDDGLAKIFEVTN